MDVMKNGLKKAGVFYFVGSLFNKGVAFLTVPIFTRLLCTSDYGIVNTYNSWVAILAMCMGFALHTSVRIAYIDYDNEMENYMATITVFTLSCGSILSIAVVLFAWYYVGDSDIWLIIFCLLQSLASALLEDYSMYLMMQYKYKLRTILMLLPNLLSVVVSVFLLKFVFIEKRYLARIIPSSLIFMLFGIFICYLIFTKSRCVFKREYLKNALHFSVPLILHGIALNMLSQSDRTMITVFADSSQTGIYSLIYNFGMIATVITTGLEGIWVPWFYRNLQQREINSINTVARDYINLMTYCLIGVIMIGPEIVKLLASSDYWEGIIIIPPVVISNFLIFIYTLYVNIEHYYKKTTVITINTLIAAVLNIVLNVIFIPSHGYVAAAYTTLVSYTISFLLHRYFSRKHEPELYPIKFFIGPLGEIVLATSLFYFYMDYACIRWGGVLIFEILMVIKERQRIAVYFPGVQ